MVEYVEDDELAQLVEWHLENHSDFKPIKSNNVGIMSVMKTELTKNGEAKPVKGRGVAVKRIGDAERSFIKNNVAFMIVVDYGKWNELNAVQRKAMVHYALMHIKVEKTDAGKIKLSKNLPDIIGFMATYRAYGFVTESELDLKDLLRGSGKAIANMVKAAAENTASEEAPPPKIRAGKVKQDEEEEDPPRVHAGVPKDEDSEDPPRVHAGVPEEADEQPLPPPRRRK